MRALDTVFIRKVGGFVFAFLLVFLSLFHFMTVNAQGQVQVFLRGPERAGPIQPDENGRFAFQDVVLRKNSVNRFIVEAVNDDGRSMQKEILITQVSLDSIVVSKVTSERLSVEQVEQLVSEGVIDLDDPENYNVSTFDIVLTIKKQPVSISLPIAIPKNKPEPSGYENIRLKFGDDASGRPKPAPVQVVVFDQPLPSGPNMPPISVPGVIVIEGNIKSLKEFFDVRLMLLNTSGIFTLEDVTANIEFPDNGLTAVMPADGIASLGTILPGSADQPGQVEKEFIIRGDEIGTHDVKVNFGGTVTGPGITDPIPFNGSAETEVEVKGPPTFTVKVSHPDSVEAGVPYELLVDITNTGELPAMYASLELDVGADGQLSRCEMNESGEPECKYITGGETRSLGHILPGQTVSEAFTVLPLTSGVISSCVGASDQNITLQVLVGDIGCMAGHYPPEVKSPSGNPTVTVLPAPNSFGVNPDSAVTAFFSERMQEGSITTGQGGSFNVYDDANNLIPGQVTTSILFQGTDHEKTVAIWQVNNGGSNTLDPNTEYTVVINQDCRDIDGNRLSALWSSTFTTTDTGINDNTPPSLDLSVEPPVNPNQVIPGQIARINAYASDQGSGIARVELRIKDMDEEGALYTLVDQKTVFSGDKPPFIFSIDSGNLVPGHSYQLMATAYDRAANAQNATLSLIIAASADPPTIHLQDDLPAEVLHGISISLEPVVTGGVREVRYYLDDNGQPFKTVNLAPFKGGLGTLNLALGNHRIVAVAEDGLGQTGQTTYEFTLLDNPNMPVVSFQGTQDGTQILEGDRLLINGKAEDPVGIASVEYFLDTATGDPIYTGTAPALLDTTGLEPGQHRIYLKATNMLGVSNDLNDPASILEFTIMAPPAGNPPPAPAISSVSCPVDNIVTLSGTSVPGARIDVTNTVTGLFVSVSADAGGSFEAAIEASEGNLLRAVAYDFSHSQDPSPETTIVVPNAPVLDHIQVSPGVMNFDTANAYQDIRVTGFYEGGSSADLTAKAGFSSSQPSVASVDESGRVVALSSGTANITVSVGGFEQVIPVNVNIVTLQYITVEPETVELVSIGQTSRLTVIGHYSDGTTQTFTSSISYASGNVNVARVNSSGVVEAVGDGSTQISVYYPGTPAVSVPVTVDTGQDPPPTVQILSPGQGAEVERGQNVSVSIRADDAIGGVTRVFMETSGETVYSDSHQVSPPTNSTIEHFSFTVSGDASIGGQILLKTRAQDTSGKLSDEVSITLHVVDRTAPYVSITSPAQMTPYNFGDTVEIRVSATDAVGVTRIRYETTGALSFSGSQDINPSSQTAEATFSFTIPYGVENPDVEIHAYAIDAQGNEGSTTPVDIILTDADITPPETAIAAVSEPGSSPITTITYGITAGLDDLDHVELYFRRNGIGTFNLYTGPDGTGDGKYHPENNGTGTIEFDSTRMGGDGEYEFYTVGVDKAGNREPAPADESGNVTADKNITFSSGTQWTTIPDGTVINEGDTTYDNLNIRIDGGTVTINGAHSFHNVELVSGAVLTHSDTTTTEQFALNISAWTITIDSTSSVDVTGKGYLGGGKTGLGETAHTVGFTPGAGSGNGGSYGGSGGHFSGSATSPNPVYGDLTNPMDLGSGGGAWSGNGGDGGGLILINSINIAMDGTMRANGEVSSGTASGDGSGGGVNISTRTISGTGSISADGGGNGSHTGGGGGRIAIRYLDLYTFTLDGVTARGGAGHYGNGADGTIFLLQESETNGELVINGRGPGSPFTDLVLPQGREFSSITLQNGAHVIAQSPIVLTGTLRVTGDSILTHPTTSESGLQIEASRVVVEEGSAIDVSGRGYPGGVSGGDETGLTLGSLAGSVHGCGGSYGGRGARYRDAGGEPNPVYGDPRHPDLLGSGGGAWSGNGGYGGGYVRIVASDELVVDGAIRADGGISSGTASGDGSGGSVWITTSRLAGDGTISANGGGNGDHVGGGGGRVAIYLDYVDSNSDLNGLRGITAFSGRGRYNSTPSAAGTIYIKYSDQDDGTLVIDDNMVDGNGDTTATAPGATQLPLIGPGVAAEVNNDTLTVDGLVSFIPNGLVGLRLNPDVSQAESFEITSNTDTTITVVTPNENGVAFGDVARAGATYGGVWVFGRVEFRRGGKLEVGDYLRVLDTVDLKEYGVLTHPETTTTYEGRLDLEVGTLLIDATSAIDVSGRGYLGGNKAGLDDGTAHTIGFASGSESGNGGSYGGLGGHFGGSGSNQPNPVYGDPSDPQDLGSGGGAWSGDGGDGGGRIFITATDIEVNGVIKADGGLSSGSASGDGSGGTVNIVTDTLSGTGLITANGGGDGGHVGGGGGRVAIRYGDVGGLTLPLENIQALRGPGHYGTGGHGTVFLKARNQSNGDLLIDGHNLDQGQDRTVIPAGVIFDNVTIQNGAMVIAERDLIASGTLLIRSGGILTHSTSSESGLQIEASRVVVEQGSAIDVSGRGYPGGVSGGDETGLTLGSLAGSVHGCGGSYGGRGARYRDAGGEPNPVYGDPRHPDLLGSGGGAWSGNGGYGGGYVRIVASDELVVDGAIRADGGISSGTASGDGSGGSVWITTSRLAGDGTISANGGGNGDHVGGGGGRVAIYLDYVDSNSDLNGLRGITAFSGRGRYNSTPSAAGTIYIKYSDQDDGTLVIDDNMVDGNGDTTATAPGATQLPLIGPGVAAEVNNDTLTVDGLVSFIPNGLVGLRLNPDVSQAESFEITSNTDTTITVVTPNENGVAFGDVARAGATYGGVWVFGRVEFRRGGKLEVGDYLRVLDTVDLKEYGVLTHPETTTTYEGRLDLEVGTLLIDATSAIDVSGRGYLGGNKAGLDDGTAHTIGFASGSESGNGGSYGGLGGHFGGSGSNQPNPVYGDPSDPQDLGSGGGAWSGDGGDGGGRIFITATDIEVNGVIKADGGLSSGSASGDGSGGTVNIVTDTLSGTGLITANGGGNGGHVGGGGGRVAVTYSQSSLPDDNITSSGGVGHFGSGQPGTVAINGTWE